MSACPVASFASSSALRFLSSRQALADLANFHSYAVARWKLTSDNKWISWGGSCQCLPCLATASLPSETATCSSKYLEWWGWGSISQQYLLQTPGCSLGGSGSSSRT